MDASGFVDATKLSRTEARQLIKDIEGARTPMEAFAAEQDRLGRALAKGGIDQATYNRLLDAKRPAIEGATMSLGPYMAAIGAVTVGVTAAAAATLSFIATMREQQNAIDETADKAQRLGVSFKDLRSLEFGFQEGGGIDAQTVGDSIKKLQINMAKAVEGDETIRSAFAKLGLDAGELIGQGPREATLKIADAMQSVGSHAERLKLSMELFGKSGADLASTLGQGRDALESSAGFAEKWLGLTDSQVAAVGANNDAWDRIGVIVDGLSQTAAAELAPAFQVVATTIIDSAGGLDGVQTAIKNAVTTATILVGVFMDGLDVVSEIGQRWHALNTGNIDGLTKPLDDSVLSLDKARSAFTQLEKNRADARASAEDAERKRQEARHSMAMEDTDKESKAKEDAAKKLAEEEKRQREAAERESRKAAEDALKNAEKYFEEERKRQMKLREDVAKGPGSGMEVGSAEAAKFMADQANQAIADSAVGVDSKPTDEQLIEYAKQNAEETKAANAKREELIKATRGVVDAIKDNGWEAV